MDDDLRLGLLWLYIIVKGLVIVRSEFLLECFWCVIV